MTDKTVYPVAPPRFEARFLLPKYWGTWLMVSILYLASWLPYRLQLMLGRGLGLLLLRLMPRRAHICLRNLALAYPEMPQAEREQITRDVFKNSGIALFETGMAWWWPDWRIRRKVSIKGYHLLAEATAKKQGVLAILFHFLSLEIHARSAGLFYPAVGLYRPHNNPVMEYLQTKGRSRSNKYLLPKKDVRSMYNALGEGELAGYLPDQDYGRHRSVFVPLFAVPDAATTTGTSLFANHPNAVTLISTLTRLPKGQGYELEFKKPLQPIPSGDDTEDARRINKELEQAVMANRSMYMWMHRRFKTRPEPEMASYYTNLEQEGLKSEQKSK